MKKRWNTIKIIMINWTIFALLASAIANYLLLENNKTLITKADNCQTTWEAMDCNLEEGEFVCRVEVKEVGK